MKHCFKSSFVVFSVSWLFGYGLLGPVIRWLAGRFYTVLCLVDLIVSVLIWLYSLNVWKNAALETYIIAWYGERVVIIYLLHGQMFLVQSTYSNNHKAQIVAREPLHLVRHVNDLISRKVSSNTVLIYKF